MKLPKKTPIAAAILVLAMNTADTAHAAQTAVYNTISSTNNNFTMLSPLSSYAVPYEFGGTNDVTFTWDGTIFTSVSDYTGPGGASNATLSSPTLFFGKKWTAHTVQIFGPGSYSFNTVTGGGNPEAGTLTLTVGAGQLGAHMLFNWGGNNNIDVVVAWDMDTTFGPLMWTGTLNPDNNTTSTTFMLSSTDQSGGDGYDGTPMATGGPFGGYMANFSMKGPLTFTFNDKTGVDLSTLVESDPITVTGFTQSSNTAGITVSGGEYAISTDGGSSYGAYTSASGTVSNGNRVKVRHTSAAANSTATSTTLMIGLHSDIFTSTTEALVCDPLDTTPDPFNFVDKSDVALGTVIESDPITVSGICAGTNTAISVSPGSEYAISSDGGATYPGGYTSVAGTVTRNDRVKVRHTSAATNSTATNTTLTIGGVSDTFTSTTIAGSIDNTINMEVEEPSMPGGCSIGPAPINALERADWWLVAGFLAWLGGIRMRLKRRA